MKKNIFSFLALLVFQIVCSQNSLKMKSESGFTDKEINSLMLFQNIDVEKLTFEGNDIVGKFYEVAVKEYKKGKLIKRTILLDIKGVDFLKIDTTITSFKLFCKIENSNITLFVKAPQIYGSKRNFRIEKEKTEDYMLKNFQGAEEFINVPVNSEFPIFAIFTPFEKEDDFGAYCEVAQSKISTEKYWEEFKIPHYFIVTMKFK